MPQVLKEETRNKIVAAAKSEFLNKGYKNASMRDIANKAEMTVGNVYRYFKNKQELVDVVIGPAILRLNIILKKNTENRITFEKEVEEIGLDIDAIAHALDSISEELILLRRQYRDEMIILMNYGKENHFIKIWVDGVIQTLLKEQLMYEITDQTLLRLLTNSLSESLFAGIHECLDADADDDRILINIKTYFRLFLNMFQTEKVVKGVK